MHSVDFILVLFLRSSNSVLKDIRAKAYSSSRSLRGELAEEFVDPCSDALSA
jgi:hypothetical protein